MELGNHHVVFHRLQHFEESGQRDQLNQLESHLPALPANFVITLESKNALVWERIEYFRLDEQVV